MLYVYVLSYTFYFIWKYKSWNVSLKERKTIINSFWTIKHGISFFCSRFHHLLWSIRLTMICKDLLFSYQRCYKSKNMINNFWLFFHLIEFFHHTPFFGTWTVTLKTKEHVHIELDDNGCIRNLNLNRIFNDVFIFLLNFSLM